MSKLHQGFFQPRNPQKYEGNPTEIIYRSSWELSVMLFCDSNDTVKSWSSESVVIPYLCPTDNRYHRYFVDFKITFSNGNIVLVELKPRKQTVAPKKPKRQTKTYINEVMTYIKNEAKWKHATVFAQQRGWAFQIWTEDVLEKLGLKVLPK